MIKKVLYLTIFIFVLFNYSINLEDDIKIETIEKKIVMIGLTDPRPVIEIKHFEDREFIAQLVQAEAGNQDLTGMCYVVDVVLNRIDSDKFPNTAEEVIMQNNQFSVIKDGNFDKAKYNVSDNAYKAVNLECNKRLNYDIIYFGIDKPIYATNYFKYQDHWFGW